MATIRKEFQVSRSPAEVWDALKDFGAVHTRLARGFVTDTQVEPSGARLVTFINGAQAREWPVSADDATRRFVYAINDHPNFTHYNASVEVREEGAGARFVWTVDFLPDAASEQQDAVMTFAAECMRTTLNG